MIDKIFLNRILVVDSKAKNKLEFKIEPLYEKNNNKKKKKKRVPSN